MLMKRKTELIRKQLDETLRRFGPLRDSSPPVKGWIRAVRDALGMNGRQLANRLGEHRSRTEQIEKQELTGSLTFKTIRRVAEALDCVFVYGLVPRTSLEETIRSRAKQLASKRLDRAAHTMGLESQALGKNENNEILSNMIEDIIDDPPSNLWDVS